jgi:hypothetical protein
VKEFLEAQADRLAILAQVQEDMPEMTPLEIETMAEWAETGEVP